jgi:hypothetical protein
MTVHNRMVLIVVFKIPLTGSKRKGVAVHHRNVVHQFRSLSP